MSNFFSKPLRNIMGTKQAAVVTPVIDKGLKAVGLDKYKDLIEGIGISLATAGMIPGIPSLTGILGNATGIKNATVLRGLSGGLQAGLSGGNPLTGALVGAYSPKLSGTIGKTLGTNPNISNILAGGVTSAIQGGNPIMGMASSALVPKVTKMMFGAPKPPTPANPFQGGRSASSTSLTTGYGMGSVSPNMNLNVNVPGMTTTAAPALNYTPAPTTYNYTQFSPQAALGAMQPATAAPATQTQAPATTAPTWQNAVASGVTNLALSSLMGGNSGGSSSASYLPAGVSGTPSTTGEELLNKLFQSADYQNKLTEQRLNTNLANQMQASGLHGSGIETANMMDMNTRLAEAEAAQRNSMSLDTYKAIAADLSQKAANDIQIQQMNQQIQLAEAQGDKNRKIQLLTALGTLIASKYGNDFINKA